MASFTLKSNVGGGELHMFHKKCILANALMCSQDFWPERLAEARGANVG